ncbi:MAG: sel1 repeat family protein [Betaproteobacteria bacterium]|nr:sel1 repeat family protein [Betaproteobacteria bacterium]MDE2123031.1 sel1 repeat family protein [Betaproteobacteria bacterium]MDE2186519.1 sel1 repeat family protein [Betaproteobacteria bacterium]MDE2324336.1 sel1 repeat family protein [Betaproteobacteria bacterium]
MMRRAADHGYGPAQYAFGLALLNGNGAGKNPRLALGYFRQACDQGMAKAAYMAGFVYATSAGDLHDPELATRYLEKTIILAGAGSAYARDAQALLLSLTTSK